jgi:hypothetical protein
MLNPLTLLVTGIAVLGFSSYLILKRIEPLYWTTVLLRSTTASVREAKNTDGIVELEGEAVRTDGQVKSPFTETACLAYGCKVEQYRSSTSKSGDRGFWKTIYRDRDGVPFRFEDDTGGVAVDPATATLFLSSGDTIQDGWGQTPGEPIESYLRRRNIERVESNVARRYSEQRFDAGDEIHVYGPITNRPITTMASEFNGPVRDADNSKWFLITDTDKLATARRLLKPNLLAILGVLGVLLGLRAFWGLVARYIIG